MSGLTKNKLSNQNLRALLERINESPTQLGREFNLDHTTIYYYRKKLARFKGGIDVFIENKQKGNWKHEVLAVNQVSDVVNTGRNYTDYLKDEEDKKNRKFETLIAKRKKQ